MKKLFWIVPAVLLLLLLIFVFVLPSQRNVTKKVAISTSQDGVVRLLTNKDRWQQWWPAAQEEIVYDSSNFSYQQELTKTAFLHVAIDDTTLLAQINTLAYRKDSSGVLFQVSLPPANNPFQKIKSFFAGRRLEAEAEDLLQRLKTFAEKEENIYNIVIRQEKVKDSALVALRFETTGYPDTKSIYNTIDELRQYIKTQDATETSPPMLHTNPVIGGKYEVMVAIPVNKPLDGAGPIEPKRMVLGNILVAEVTGGVYTAEKALQSLSGYVNDKRRTSPAIPYQSLITDRRQEPDTAKWITRLYHPVI